MTDARISADGSWSPGGCIPQPEEPFYWWGVPNSGSWGWTARYGTYWIGGAIYQVWKNQGYECGGLGVPVKAASGDFHLQWSGADQGQWFKGGAIVRRWGVWQIMPGDYGQTAGRLAESVPATEPGLMPEGEPPPITDEMQKASERQEVE